MVLLHATAIPFLGYIVGTWKEEGVGSLVVMQQCSDFFLELPRMCASTDTQTPNCGFYWESLHGLGDCGFRVWGLDSSAGSGLSGAPIHTRQSIPWCFAGLGIDLVVARIF
jgi:hypothetical protein